jgi:hypothetical protein
MHTDEAHRMLLAACAFYRLRPKVGLVMYELQERRMVVSTVVNEVMRTTCGDEAFFDEHVLEVIESYHNDSVKVMDALFLSIDH